MKWIYVSESEKQELEFEEVLEKYKSIITRYVYRWSATYEYDELYQTGLIALWQAYNRYDHTHYQIPFGALATKYIKYALMNYHNKHRSKFARETSQIKSLISYNQPVSQEDEAFTLEDVIGTPDNYTETVLDHIVIDKVFSKFSRSQLEDIQKYIQGYNLKELAEDHNTHRNRISQRMRNNFEKFQRKYIQEVMV